MFVVFNMIVNLLYRCVWSEAVMNMNSRGAVWNRHEECDTEPHDLQQSNEEPFWPVQNHILNRVPPVVLRASCTKHTDQHDWEVHVGTQEILVCITLFKIYI